MRREDVPSKTPLAGRGELIGWRVGGATGRYGRGANRRPVTAQAQGRPLVHDVPSVRPRSCGRRRRHE